MPSSISRKEFVHLITKGGAAAFAGLHLPTDLLSVNSPVNELYSLSESLLTEWSEAVLKLQVTDKNNTVQYGGILSPDTGKVPGRCADALYPFFCMAERTGKHVYTDAAQLVYQWMEQHVSDTDGAWLNEPQKNSWKGITVFTVMAICEALKHHHKIIPPHFKVTLENRVHKAAEYVYNNFSIDYGNINYPISAAYALSLAATLLDVKRWKDKGRTLAQQSMKFISANDKLIFGEGQPYYQKGPKGCLPVDLGYNVEESLPALVQYGLLVNDQELLETLKISMQSHLEFMLPDGAWDNSWGTRNYKWTYWGSRTSDGCQAAFGLMKDLDPRFYVAALKNLQLLKSYTFNGLLHGGPHLQSHGITPNVHHSFCHMKTLANVLNKIEPSPVENYPQLQLPRETSKGIKFFSDIQTWLVATGSWRATVTGYDREYKDFKNGHPTGGAISMLWHPLTGPLLTASMNEYQLYEKDNMQEDKDPLSMALTPRIELQNKEGVFASCSDLSAEITAKEEGDSVVIRVRGHLVNGKQQHPSFGPIPFYAAYKFTEKNVRLDFSWSSSDRRPTIIVPVISKSGENITSVKNTLQVQKANTVVQVTCNQPMKLLPTANGRVFNFVPGIEAVPIGIFAMSASILIELK